MRSVTLRTLVSVSVFALATPAFAQKAPATDDEATADADKQIVVTGTSLRGIVPAGAQAISLTSDDIKATGATSTQALLASIPQMGSFNGTPFAGVGGSRLTVNRINLRSLPIGTGGGSPTLVLIDGHRFVGSGIQQAASDPSIIPPGMVERTEVVLGGGSAVYGADAIGGVLNFILKKDVDGFEIRGTHGFGDHYHSNNVDFLAGKTWDTGSVYVGYSYARNSAVNNADRDYERNGSYATGVFAVSDLQCNPGNLRTVTAAGAAIATYAITSPTTFTLGNSQLCDRSKFAQSFPDERRHSVMGGFRQEIGDALEVSVKGYYSLREDLINSTAAAPLGFTVNKRIGDAAYAGGLASYVPVTAGDTTNQQVSGTFSAWTGFYQPTRTKLTSWGITPSLTWKIGGDWQMKAFYNVGESHTTSHEVAVNTTALQDAARGCATITATCLATYPATFNPYNPGAASNATAVATALNWENYGIGISHLDNAKVVFDGPAFHLGGGDVRVAVGAEYIKEAYRGISGISGTRENTINTTLNPLTPYSRNEKSAFGEINIPIVGPDNSMAGIYSFNLQGAVRYDSYSDFGHNWSPSVGASLKPVEWLNLRANWNKSFQAPSPADLAFTTPTLTYRAPTIYSQVPLLVNSTTNIGGLAGGGRTGASTAFGFLNIGGTAAGLQPQKATNFSLGFDLSPPMISGLTLKFSYFHIDYSGVISIPPHGSQPTYWANFPDLYAMNPTYAQVDAILTAANISAAQRATALTSANCSPTLCNLYVISDDRGRNLGNAKVSGLDLGFDFRQETGFGSIFANFNGTYLLNFQTSPSATAPLSVNGVGNQSAAQSVQRFNFTSTVGFGVGKDFRAQLKWNHTDGYDLLQAAGLGQTKVTPFNTFDFFSSLDVDQGGLPPFTLSLGVTNLFGQNPPNFNGSGGTAFGYVGSTLGRVVSVGASVKF